MQIQKKSLNGLNLLRNNPAKGKHLWCLTDITEEASEGDPKLWSNLVIRTACCVLKLWSPDVIGLQFP